MIAVITLLARATGFARWFVFSGTVGTTCVGNGLQRRQHPAQRAATRSRPEACSPRSRCRSIAGQLGRGDEAVADRIASALLTWAVTLLVPLAALLVLLAGPISELLLVRTSQCPGAQQLGADMIRVFAPQVPLYGIGIVLAGVLQAHRRFLAAALAPLLLQPRRHRRLPAVRRAGARAAATTSPRCRPRRTLALTAGHHARGRGAEPAAARSRCCGPGSGCGPPGASPTASRPRRAGSLAGRPARAGRPAGRRHGHGAAGRNRGATGTPERLPVHPGRLPAAVRRARRTGGDLGVPGARGGGRRRRGARRRGRCRRGGRAGGSRCRRGGRRRRRTPPPSLPRPPLRPPCCPDPGGTDPRPVRARRGPRHGARGRRAGRRRRAGRVGLQPSSTPAARPRPGPPRSPRCPRAWWRSLPGWSASG